GDGAKESFQRVLESLTEDSLNLAMFLLLALVPRYYVRIAAKLEPPRKLFSQLRRNYRVAMLAGVVGLIWIVLTHLEKALPQLESAATLFGRAAALYLFLASLAVASFSARLRRAVLSAASGHADYAAVFAPDGPAASRPDSTT